MSDSTTVLFLLKRVDCNDGVSSYCETLLTGMKAKGDKVIVISGRVTSSAETEARRRAIEAASEAWICLDDLNPRRMNVKTLKVMLAAIRRYSVDVISPQGLSMLPLSYLLSKLSRKPIVANYHPSIHGSNVEQVARSKSLKERLAYRLTAACFSPWMYIAISQHVVKFFRDDCKISSRRIENIVLGVDLARYRLPSAEERKIAKDFFRLSDTDLVCILTGRLNFNKGHDLVIDAVRKLRVSNPDLSIVCLFPGSGADAEAIKELAFQEVTDENAFRFLGFVDDETLLKAYWAADVALLPSRLEGFGLAVAEAMACGAVPIRTPSGGVEDQIVDGVTGFVVPFNDSAALAARIGDLSNEERRSEMRKAAAAHAVAHFDNNSMVLHTSELYRRAKSGRKRSIRSMGGAQRNPSASSHSGFTHST